MKERQKERWIEKLDRLSRKRKVKGESRRETERNIGNRE